jgi:tripartite-type tricarboxylate transporter receptor subunit TctC
MYSREKDDERESAMEFPRRAVLRLAAGAASVAAAPRFARAEAYPTRPVRLIVPFAPGGGTDLCAHLLGEWLAQRLGQPFLVINRTGAASNVGTDVVVKAAPDGYTLLAFDPSAAINATLYANLGFVFLRDIAPVALIMRTPILMAVHPSLPAKSVAEFIAYAKANPGKINMSSGGVGSTPHVSGELFKMMTGTQLVHVPYRGSGPARVDLLGGQVQLMFDPIASTLGHVKAGQLRALAVASATRSEVLPDVPIIAETVPGYESDTWYGIGAPAGTPPEIVDRLNREINAGLADPALKARLAELGGTIVTGTPADFHRLIVAETAKWGKVVKFAGIKAE